MTNGKLTNGELSTELQDLIERAEGEIPQEITNKILSIMIEDTNRSIRKIRGETKESLNLTKNEIMDSITQMEDKVLNELSILSEKVSCNTTTISEIQKEQKEYPSISKWTTNHKKQSLIIVTAFFLVSQLWFVSGFRYIILSSLLYLAGKLFGLPAETIESILGLLFA